MAHRMAHRSILDYCFEVTTQPGTRLSSYANYRIDWLRSPWRKPSLLIGKTEPDGKCAAFPGDGVNCERVIVHLDNRFRDGKTQASPTDNAFAGPKEWLEDAPQVFCFNADASIAHFDDGVACFCPHFYVDTATCWRIVNRIDDQVDDDLHQAR